MKRALAQRMFTRHLARAGDQPDHFHQLLKQITQPGTFWSGLERLLEQVFQLRQERITQSSWFIQKAGHRQGREPRSALSSVPADVCLVDERDQFSGAESPETCSLERVTFGSREDGVGAAGLT